jgi:hypothetical protein
LTNVTVGAGMITGSSSELELSHVSSEERAARFAQKATSIALTGKNKDSVAYQLERKLFDNGHATIVLTGSISFGLAFVAGRKRVPKPATGKTAFVIFCVIYQILIGVIGH